MASNYPEIIYFAAQIVFPLSSLIPRPFVADNLIGGQRRWEDLPASKIRHRKVPSRKLLGHRWNRFYGEFVVFYLERMSRENGERYPNCRTKTIYILRFL